MKHSKKQYCRLIKINIQVWKLSKNIMSKINFPEAMNYFQTQNIFSIEGEIYNYGIITSIEWTIQFSKLME
jgi:hypothetical protein